MDNLLDVLPGRLWAFGNLYRVFGHSLHLCVGNGVRTIELDGRELAHGRKPFEGFHRGPSERLSDLLWRFDLGWTAVALVGLALLAAVSGIQAGSTRSRANR